MSQYKGEISSSWVTSYHWPYLVVFDFVLAKNSFRLFLNPFVLLGEENYQGLHTFAESYLQVDRDLFYISYLTIRKAMIRMAPFSLKMSQKDLKHNILRRFFFGKWDTNNFTTYVLPRSKGWDGKHLMHSGCYDSLVKRRPVHELLVLPILDENSWPNGMTTKEKQKSW